MPDEVPRDLLERFVRGDDQAFESLFRLFEREVYRWILRIVRDPSAAEDALVDAFWRAHRARARFDPSRSFGAWMRRIATNSALAQIAVARRHLASHQDNEPSRPGATAPEEIRESVQTALVGCRRSSGRSQCSRCSRSIPMLRLPRCWTYRLVP
jgi:DNA-directed RNA polymerase specialized sigma subunit, sigma24 homolog